VSSPALTAILIAAGYLSGSVPTGYWLVLALRREDIRRHGSHSIGASNVFRTYGKRLGVPVILIDFGKGFVPTFFAVRFDSHNTAVAVAIAAMLGNWRPIFLRFSRGGKMIATGGGAFFALAPLAGVAALALWTAVFFLGGFSSVASIAAALAVPVATWLFGYPKPIVALGVAVFAFVVWLHRPNLSRLRRGTENRSPVALLPRLIPRVR
jgi:glycerol-3-phosphate acyltransferase PlsY